MIKSDTEQREKMSSSFTDKQQIKANNRREIAKVLTVLTERVGNYFPLFRSKNK